VRKGHLLNSFPSDYTPSTSQIEAIKKVDKAFQNKKFVVVSAPTGTGKSFIAATLANASYQASDNFKNLISSYKAFDMDISGNYVNEVECLKEPPHGAFILTITKNLQDQYKNLFPECTVFKGKRNYTCNVDEVSDIETAPCLFAPKLKTECCAKNFCSYYNTKNDAIISNFTVLNYKLFQTLPKHIRRRNYIVCDEASELEGELVKNYTLNIQIQKLRQSGISVERVDLTDSRKVKTWLYDLRLQLDEKVTKLVNRFSKKNSNVVVGERLQLIFLKTTFHSIDNVLNYWDDEEWVADYKNNEIIITPLKVNKFAKNIFDSADQILLMSATIIDHKHFTKNLGIEDYEYIETGSVFDPKNSPIYITGKTKLNYYNIDAMMPKLAKSIKTICAQHSKDKGIIHTHNMDITKKLKNLLPDDRYLFRDIETTNENLISKHCTTDQPTVLVSPSLGFGVDLKDDLARFCIVVKLPFLPLGDKRIKKLCDRDKDWYENAMLNNLVQMCGRTTRSKKDYSTTYILDGNSINALIRAKHKLPSYFIERIQ
jgi:energy-coupling factor transporter ATP-binding protein EcfA2